MALLLPVTSTRATWRALAFAGEVLRYRTRFSRRTGRWYLSVADMSGAMIIADQPLHPMWVCCRAVRDRLGGLFVVLDTEAPRDTYAAADLGTTLFVQWVANDDLEAPAAEVSPYRVIS